MISYYGFKISPNQLETGEGFLICRNVPIARTGDMQYRADELGLEGSEMITVCRTPDEVFSEAALASFEGKPATDEHPPELLTPDTFAVYAKGHVQNIRRGTGEWDGYVIADLHIQDESLIREVQNGKREISCGYDCEFVENEDGTYSQRNIRGNHVAIVTAGRAGKKAAILDSKQIKQAEKPERKQIMKKKTKFGSVMSLFARAARDASPEEAETLAADAAEAAEALEGAEDNDPDTPTGDDDPVKDDDRLDRILAALEKLVGIQAGGAGDDESETSPLDEAIEVLENAKGAGDNETEDDETGDDEEALVVPAEEMDNDETESVGDAAAVAAILKSMRPAIATIKDDAERRRITDTLLASMGLGRKKSDIARIMKTTQKNAKKAADSKPKMDLDACQSAYDKRNPHKNGGTK